MFDPQKDKGVLSLNNRVNIREFQGVAMIAAIGLLMYDKEFEEYFRVATNTVALKSLMALTVRGVKPVTSRREALREIYAARFEQCPEAKEALLAMEDRSTTDVDITAVFEEFYNAEFKVDTIEEVVEEAPVVESINEPAEVEVVEAIPVVEVSVEAEAEHAEEQTEVVVEEQTEVVTDGQTEAIVEESVEAVVEEQTEVATEEPVETSTETDPTEQAPVEAPVDTVVEEEPKPVSYKIGSDLVETSSENKYHAALVGKLSKEVSEYKILPSKQTAVALCNKIMSLLPGETMLDLVYNQDVIHALYIEFDGAVHLLSSFRINAVALAGMQN